MRCLYCGKQLALFRRLTGGGEFCSDAHKASYHDEFNRLALARLKQAQEKSDELRAAAPQNQLALIRRGPGEPEGPTIRSNAHWIEPKPSRSQQGRKALSSAPPEPAQPDPKPCEFISGMPAPAQPAPLERPTCGVDPAGAAIPPHPPEWSPSGITSELPAAAPVHCTLLPGTAVPEPAKLIHSAAGATPPDALQLPIESRKPDWNPPVATTEVPAAGHVEAGAAPLPREYQIATDIPVPANVEMKTPHTSVPPVGAMPPIVPVYPSLPPVPIDPLEFAPRLAASVETRSQFLPLHFDFTAFPAPDFDILEPAGTPAPRLKVRPRTVLKRTEQEHSLDPPEPLLQPFRKRGNAPGPALEMGMIGEIAALANPLTLFPRLATPAETKPEEPPVQANAVLPQPPPMVMPHSAIDFRTNERTAPVAISDDQDDKRPSTLKVKLAAMTSPVPPSTPVPESPKPAARQGLTNRIPERKPVERSTAQQAAPRVMSAGRRRTVPIPSILEPPPDPDGEHRSLWGALRKYLGK